MKKSLLAIAIAAVTALTFTAGPVSAQTMDMGSLSPPTDSFSVTASGLFDGRWAIKLGTDKLAGFSLTNVELVFGPVVFNRIVGLAADVDGNSLSLTTSTIPNGNVSTWSWVGMLSAGTHYLHMVGDFGSQASLGGNVVLAEVPVNQMPEPATWTMWLAALAAVGFTGKRRGAFNRA